MWTLIAQAFACATVSGAFWIVVSRSDRVRSFAATPLILTRTLRRAIAFRAGVFNIGAEGQFLIGAATGTAVALAGASLPAVILIPAGLVAGALGGALWAGIAAQLRVRFHVLEVISTTIMLNFVAINLVSYLVRGPLQEPTHVYPQTSTIATAAQLPRFGAGTRLHLGFLIALVSCGVAWWIIRATAAGFSLARYRSKSGCGTRQPERSTSTE